MNKSNFYILLIILISFLLRYFLFNQSSNFASALIGSVIPIALYYLITTIHPKTKSIALISAAILAINPLNLHFSNTLQWQLNLYPLIIILFSIILFKTINPQKLTKLIKFLLILTIPIYIISTLFISRDFLILYFTFFSPEFLIFQADWQNIQQFAPYIGIILFPTYIFLLIGIFSNSNYKIQKKFFLLMLLLSPIPAVLKNDSTSLGFLLTYSLPLIYFASLGIINTYNTLSKTIIKNSFTISLFTIYLIYFFYYSDLYLIHLLIK